MEQLRQLAVEYASTYKPVSACVFGIRGLPRIDIDVEVQNVQVLVWI